MKTIVFLISALLALSACASSQEKTISVTQKEFAQQMAEWHGFDAAAISAWLNKAQHRDSIIEAMTRPAEGKPWHLYRKIFITNRRIKGGVSFFNTHRDLLQRAYDEHGVDPYVITAIIGVESSYGANTGSYPVIDALKTLSFGYPRRADFFRKQLEEFFLMAREENLDPMQPKGSYAGAMGMPQFIPSSFRSYAIDFDADGKRNLWDNHADIIGSVANYFAVHGWQKNQPVARLLPTKPEGLEPGSRRGQKPNISPEQLKNAGITLTNGGESVGITSIIKLQQEKAAEYWLGFNNFYVITRYNHSNLYAMAVYQLSEEIRKASK
ncbi:lytic murein transglycosylase B [Solemya velum gill symbiont]|uniref:lytic murein transglycosylase B n=1 Tax=Solemya velum gill symbiont TaxID=2340 RepID=UPI0009978B6F|nr:lytic murein transglycosylase B [Solemya velum gill symbiont]OOZ34897.1 lytic murein transglycosylase B [Solemya velum gill symbiont]